MTSHTTEPYRNPDLPLQQRVDDLLGRLTAAERIAFLHQHQPAVPRLGLERWTTGTEALHGVAWMGPATVFPQAVGLGATWDPELVRRVGDAVGDEVRAFRNRDRSSTGLNVWAPVVNLLRDPRWGRNEEGYAEDPLLTSDLATAYASGMRGDHPRVLKTAPTLKHFLAYNNETRRETTSSCMPPRVLHEYELPAYRGPLQAGAALAVMPSYNLVNGRPAHLSPLINSALREWARDGLFVTSDALAPSNVAGEQAYLPDQPSGHAALLHAGVDSFTDNATDAAPTIAHVTEALERGLITMEDVDRAVRRSLELRMRLGDFDPPERDPFAHLTWDVVNCPEHRELAREAARASVVLLRNAPGATGRPLLPLDPAALRSVAVIGPLADMLYEDWYSGTLPYGVTPVDGLRARLGEDVRVTLHDGARRVLLRLAGTDRCLAVDGTVVRTRVTGERPAEDPDCLLDLMEWSPTVRTLRAVGGGFLSAQDPTDDVRDLQGVVKQAGERILTADQPRPNGWVVHETFVLEDVPGGGTRLRNVAAGYAVHRPASDDVTFTDDPERATVFEVVTVVDGVAEAARLAAEADVAVVVVGNDPLINGRETEDREELELPDATERLVRAVRAANPRTVLVVESSYPFAIGWADAHVDAICWLSHGGQETGAALAEVLCGDVSPAGRLPQTWYRSAADLPDLLDYDIIGSDATYQYFRGRPLYPFGHGLSYTTFGYGGLRLDRAEVDADGEVRVTVEVTNTGDREGEEVVQLYTRQRGSTAGGRLKLARRALRGYRRVRLAAGETAEVDFRLAARDLAVWDTVRGRMVVDSARHLVMVGSSSEDIRATAHLRVSGETLLPHDPAAGTVRAADCDAFGGAVLGDATPERGDVVVSTAAGDWVVWEDVRLPDDAGFCRLTVAQGGDKPGEVRLLLDDPLDGAVAGAATVQPGGGPYAWREVDVRLRASAGRHDLYVVFTDPGTRLAELSLHPGADAATPGTRTVDAR
ncbi:glycoside hydrolase family 3 C-terminal domain-containing protein [Allostreptomyces psammosilenae]|uniref:Exo-alpha-(1->6)-L-arabinopyranosidase n=1 Tax=Allostreptomyces psammosilenae TaxID=1892865 RepID=A0A853A1V3_9ACTN|nr:glycoside hydrolase family 3 C-terminal domain-containing protein [Allostreptomyces psammosilenae]NYI04408.1 beta-glucosidase [Allostreptomyces psammosilenae]